MVILFSKNCLTLFVSGREKKHFFRAHYMFWPTNSLGPKQWKPGKTVKIVVSAEVAQKQMTLFLKKGVFDMGEKVSFTNCVFEKLCSSENTSFRVFSAKHSSCNIKAVCWKIQTIYEKNSGLFVSMAKSCFLFVLCLFFQALMLLWFVFVCLVKLQKC